MKDRRIEASIARTINLSDYESLKVQAGLSFDIADTEDEVTRYEEAWRIVEDQVGIESGKLEKELTNKTERIRRREADEI